MTIGNTKRFNVFKRDGFQCQYCGRQPPEVVLEVDHVVPQSKGGGDDALNLLTACFECNRGKRDHHLHDVPKARTEIIEIERERSAQTKLYNKHLMKLRKQSEKHTKEIGLYWYNKYKTEKDAFVFGTARIPSIRKFLDRLPVAEILNAIDIAYDRCGKNAHNGNDYKMWKYFCGICWRKIKGEGKD